MKRKLGIKTIETNFQLIKIVKRQFGNEKKTIVRIFLEAWNKLTLNHRLGAILYEIMGCQSDLYKWGQKKGINLGSAKQGLRKLIILLKHCLMQLSSSKQKGHASIGTESLSLKISKCKSNTQFIVSLMCN